MARKTLNLPSEVTILGQSFTIVDKKLEEGNYGETCGASGKIEIDKTKHTSQELLDSTLLHEVIHGILYVSGQSEMLSEQQEEGLVIALENGLRNIISLDK